MSEHQSFIKEPKAKRSKGRARPDEPLADFCEARTVVCTRRAECRHHKLLRAQGGTDAPEHTADLCGACHRFVHSRVEWAFEHGWLLHAWDTA